MRNFIKTLIITLVSTICISSYASPKIAISNYPWKRLTLETMLNDIKDSDVEYIFAFHGIKLGGDGAYANDTFSHTMSKEANDEMQAMLKKYNKKIIGIGHVKYSDPKDIEAVFKFCKDTGIEIMTIEAPTNALKIYDEMAIKYGVDGGLYNHAGKAPFATPQKALNGIKGLEKIKTFPDIGQWGRSNLDIMQALDEVSPENIIAVSLQNLVQPSSTKKKGPDCEEFSAGKLPLKDFVTKLNAGNFNGYYIVMFANTSNRSQIEKVLPSVEYLKSINK